MVQTCTGTMVTIGVVERVAFMCRDGLTHVDIFSPSLFRAQLESRCHVTPRRCPMSMSMLGHSI